MKSKVVIVLLALTCAGLVIALMVMKKQGEEQRVEDGTALGEASNQVVEANQRLRESGQVNLAMSNNLAVSREEVSADTEKMGELTNHLTAANGALASAEETVTNLNNRVADLEAQNKVLDARADSLSNALAQVVAQIEETKNELGRTRTNAAFLQVELQKQLAQKAELEHKFDDLAELRGQVKKLKEEMFIARRIEIMAHDIGNKKGGELLMMHGDRTADLTPWGAPGANYGLNVEIGSDHTTKVLPPPPATNPPAH